MFLLVTITSYFVAMLLAAVVSTQQIAIACYPLIFVFQNTFVGFVISLNNIPTIWSWAPYISNTRFVFIYLDYVVLMKYADAASKFLQN
jgi:hypothetical protein